MSSLNVYSIVKHYVLCALICTTLLPLLPDTTPSDIIKNNTLSAKYETMYPSGVKIAPKAEVFPQPTTFIRNPVIIPERKKQHGVG